MNLKLAEYSKKLTNFLHGSALKSNDEVGIMDADTTSTCPFISNLDNRTQSGGVLKYLTANVICCITCTLYKKIYIGETGQKLSDPFANIFEMLQEMTKTPRNQSCDILIFRIIMAKTWSLFILNQKRKTQKSRTEIYLWNRHSKSDRKQRTLSIPLIYYSVFHDTTNSVAPPFDKLHTTHNLLIASSDEGIALET